MIRYILSLGIVTIVYSSIFQGNLGIIRDTDAYSATFTGMELGGRGRPPLSFFKIQKVS